MKYAFLGAGNMGGAIVRRLTSSGFVKGCDVLIYDVSRAAVDAIECSFG